MDLGGNGGEVSDQEKKGGKGVGGKKKRTKSD